MSTFSGLYAFDMTVLANYQVLMGDIYDQIAAQGWIRTADTGQTNPRTVGALPATDATTIYSIYKTGDALTPLYARIEFMRNVNSWPTLGVKIGPSTDGAGTITGTASSHVSVTSALSSTGQAVYISCDVDRMGIALSPANADSNQTTVVVIGRSKDGNGNSTSDHATVNIAGYNGITYQRTITFNGLDGGDQIKWRGVTPYPTGGTQWTVGTHMGVTFVVPMPIPYGANPTHDVGMWGLSQAFTPGATSLVNVYGANHTYLFGNRTVDDNNFAKWMMRFE